MCPRVPRLLKIKFKCSTCYLGNKAANGGSGSLEDPRGGVGPREGGSMAEGMSWVGTAKLGIFSCVAGVV